MVEVFRTLSFDPPRLHLDSPFLDGHFLFPSSTLLLAVTSRPPFLASPALQPFRVRPSLRYALKRPKRLDFGFHEVRARMHLHAPLPKCSCPLSEWLHSP
eukprot:6190868-Pleurochrysis_carterae.AAC.1